MRVLVIVKATASSEAGIPPSTELLTAMGQYNQQLVNAGVLLAGEGLHPSAKGVRVRVSDEARTVIPGPFPITGDLVAGYWLWNVASMDDAIAWARQCPNPMPGSQTEIELRPLFEADDFGDELTPELRAADTRMRAQSAART